MLKKTKVLCIKTPKRQKESVNIKSHTNNCLHAKHFLVNCACPTLEEIEYYKYLGLYIDNKFCWEKQVRDICNKLRACATQFFKLQFILNYKYLKMVYSALVQSIMAYGIQCYGTCTGTNKGKIDSINNKIIKMIRRKNHNNDTMDILSFDQLYKYTMIKKYYYRTELMEKVHHKYELRENKYKIPKTFNKYGERTKRVVVPKLMNSLPGDLHDLTKISEVKRKIKKWLQE